MTRLTGCLHFESSGQHFDIGADLDGLRAFIVDDEELQPLKVGFGRFYALAEELPDGFCPEGAVSRSMVQGPEGDPVLEYSHKAERALHLISDAGAKGFPMGMWLHNRGRVNGSYATDVHAHDVNNSWKRACSRAGLWLLILEWGLVANFRKAPFNSDENFAKFHAAGLNYFALLRAAGFVDDIWEVFYLKIAAAMGMTPGEEEENSLAHQEALLQRCEEWLDKAGELVKSQRWFAIWDVMEEKLRFVAPLLQAILIYRGFISTWEEAAADLLLFARDGEVVAQAATATGVDAVPEPRRGVKQSSDEFHRLRSSSSHGTEHLVACILANSLGSKIMKALSVLIRPCRRRHGEAMVAAKTPRGAEELRRRDAAGRWVDELLQLAGGLEDQVVLAEAGYLDPGRLWAASDEEMRTEDHVADAIHAWMREMLFFRIVYGSQVELAWPWCSALLLETDPEKLQGHLRGFKRLLQAIYGLDEECKTDVNAQRFRLRCAWPLWRWVRGILVRLAEADFKQVPQAFH